MEIQRMLFSVIFPDERNVKHFDFEDPFESYKEVLDMHVKPATTLAFLMSTKMYEENDVVFRFFLSPNSLCCLMKGPDDFIIPLFDDMVTQIKQSNPQLLKGGEQEFSDIISKLERPESHLQYMKVMLDMHKLYYV